MSICTCGEGRKCEQDIEVVKPGDKSVRAGRNTDCFEFSILQDSKEDFRRLRLRQAFAMPAMSQVAFPSPCQEDFCHTILPIWVCTETLNPLTEVRAL